MPAFSVSSLTSILNQLLPEPHAGLLAGLLFGTKATLSHEFYDALVTTGTLHIIALSGQNISIMIDIIGKMLVPLVGKRWASAMSIGVICWFVWFVGPSASIVRAAIMGSISLIALIFGRQYWAMFSWIIAVGGMVILHAEWIYDISFQLSALATLGIILFGKNEKNIFLTTLRLTLAAQTFTIPLILFSFHRLSLISPLANLAIGWIIAPVTLLGWVTVLSGFVLLYIGKIVALIDWILLEYLIRTIYFISRIPFASIAW